MAKPGPIYSRIPGRPASLILLYPNSTGETHARSIKVQSIGALPDAEGGLVLSHLRGLCPPTNQARTFLVTKLQGAIDAETGAQIEDLSQWFRDDAAARTLRPALPAEPKIIEEHITIEIAAPMLRLPPIADLPPPPQQSGWVVRTGLTLAVLLVLAGCLALLLPSRNISEAPPPAAVAAPITFYPEAAFWIGIGITCDPARTEPFAAITRLRDAIAKREAGELRDKIEADFIAGLTRGNRPIPDRVCDRGIVATRAALREQ